MPVLSRGKKNGLRDLDLAYQDYLKLLGVAELVEEIGLEGAERIGLAGKVRSYRWSRNKVEAVSKARQRIAEVRKEFGLCSGLEKLEEDMTVRLQNCRCATDARSQ